MAFALGLAVLTTPARANTEIYSSEMHSQYDSLRDFDAPCANSGYYTIPPHYILALCISCKASIKKAKEKVENYGKLCEHTHDVEIQTAVANQTSVQNTFSSQYSADNNGGNVQSDGSNGERQKREDAATLRDEAKACVEAVKCDGPLAGEDIAAGKAVKAACKGLQDGATAVYDEKNHDSSTMSGLNGQDTAHYNSLGQMGTNGNFVSNPMAAIEAQSAAMSAGAAAGMAAAGAGMAAGIALSNFRSGGHGGSGGVLAPSLDANGFGPGSYNATTLGRAAGKVSAALSWSDYMSVAKASKAAQEAGASPASGEAGDAAASDSSGSPGSSDSSQARRMAQKARSDGASLDGPGASAPGVIKSKDHAYSDPWMDYVSGESGRQLVEKLRESADLRREIKKKILELMAEENASPGTNAARAERLEYYKAALAEAEKQLQQGSLNALAPLDSREAFAMDDAETRREVQRMLASMHGSEGDDSPYSLFPRVHKALWRQVGAGKLRLLKPKPAP